MRYKNKTALVYDNGLFIEIAIMLAKDFGRVLYFMPWSNGYPKSNALLVGRGVPGITRIDSIWPYIDEVDVFVFPDVNDGPLQCYLESIGKRVWGARMGEELELFRAESKKHQKSVGINIGEWKLVRGVERLRDYLKEHDNTWIKISRTRGDGETFKSDSYNLVKPKLDELEYKLGAKAKIMEFICESDIPAVAEVGYDGYVIDGQFPKNCMFGFEMKDKSFVMKTTKYDQLPEQIRDMNDKLVPTFRDYGYRGFWSTELRVTKDGKAYSIDPCARAGSPPSELYQLMVENWADIIWHGAGGELVEPVFKAKYGAELLLISDWGDSNFLPLQFPNSIRENVKLRYLTYIDGIPFVVPQESSHPEVGAVVACGDTLNAAMSEVKRIAEQVKGFYVETFPNTLDDAEAQFRKLRDIGIKV